MCQGLCKKSLVLHIESSGVVFNHKIPGAGGIELPACSKKGR